MKEFNDTRVVITEAFLGNWQQKKYQLQCTIYYVRRIDGLM